MIAEDREFVKQIARAFNILSDCAGKNFGNPIMIVIAAELDRLAKRFQRVIDVEGPE